MPDTGFDPTLSAVCSEIQFGSFVFTPNQIGVMREAMRKACAALQFSHPGGPDEHVKQLVAMHIVELVGSGGMDAGLVTNEALRRMPPLAAHWIRLTENRVGASRRPAFAIRDLN